MAANGGVEPQSPPPARHVPQHHDTEHLALSGRLGCRGSEGAEPQSNTTVVTRTVAAERFKAQRLRLSLLFIIHIIPNVLAQS